MKIPGSTIIVTGASAGIGAATARELSARGANLLLTGRNTDALAALEGELAGSLAVPADLTDPAAAARIADAAISRFGRIDALVNNAGQGLHVPVEGIDPEAFRTIFDLNVIAPLRMMQAVIPTMRAQGGGAIVNISSGTTTVVPAGFAAYA
ncbi:MAG: SDR family oxidoreductase, partial [Thermomicrobiales bacterium]